MRLLIVDDDTALLNVISRSLSKLGHQVDTAIDGEIALEILKREKITVVITDWGMPKMDGVELCKAIRSQIPYDVYVILLTGRSTSLAQLDSIATGADDYLLKPFGIPSLVSSIQTAERILTLPPGPARDAMRPYQAA